MDGRYFFDAEPARARIRVSRVPFSSQRRRSGCQPHADIQTKQLPLGLRVKFESEERWDNQTGEWAASHSKWARGHVRQAYSSQETKGDLPAVVQNRIQRQKARAPSSQRAAQNLGLQAQLYRQSVSIEVAWNKPRQGGPTENFWVDSREKGSDPEKDRRPETVNKASKLRYWILASTCGRPYGDPERAWAALRPTEKSNRQTGIPEQKEWRGWQQHSDSNLIPQTSRRGVTNDPWRYSGLASEEGGVGVAKRRSGVYVWRWQELSRQGVWSFCQTQWKEGPSRLWVRLKGIPSTYLPHFLQRDFHADAEDRWAGWWQRRVLWLETERSKVESLHLRERRNILNHSEPGRVHRPWNGPASYFRQIWELLRGEDHRLRAKEGQIVRCNEWN